MQHTMKNNNTLIIDGHEDIAWNALELGRDVLQSVYAGRAQENDSHLGERLVGFPELLKGRIGLVFATTFVPPASHAKGLDIRVIPQDAQRLHQQQMQYYQQLTERTSQTRIVKTWKDVQEVLSSWDSEQPQVGLVMLMEGADGILEPEDVGAWYEEGLRIIEAIYTICQIAGSAQHVAIGSDFDGGFGLDSIPPELDSIADLYKIGDALSQQGYIQADIEAVLKDNWLRILKKSLPTA